MFAFMSLLANIVVVINAILFKTVTTAVVAIYIIFSSLECAGFAKGM
jgi:hypothetical protein